MRLQYVEDSTVDGEGNKNLFAVSQFLNYPPTYRVSLQKTVMVKVVSDAIKQMAGYQSKLPYSVIIPQKLWKKSSQLVGSGSRDFTNNDNDGKMMFI